VICKRFKYLPIKAFKKSSQKEKFAKKIAKSLEKSFSKKKLLKNTKGVQGFKNIFYSIFNFKSCRSTAKGHLASTLFQLVISTPMQIGF